MIKKVSDSAAFILSKLYIGLKSRTFTALSLEALMTLFLFSTASGHLITSETYNTS